MITREQAKTLEVVVPARPVVGQKCTFSVVSLDDLQDVEIVEKEIQPANEYDQPTTRKFVEIRLYGKWLGNGKDIVDSAKTVMIVTGLATVQSDADNLWARVVKALQVADFELLVIPRYIEYVEGQGIAKCYINDLEIEK